MNRALVAFVQKKAMDHTKNINLSSSLPQNNKTREIFANLGVYIRLGRTLIQVSI